MQISKKDLEVLSVVRLQEAQLLFENEQYSGAYYVAGYSIEFALKACIAKNFHAGVIPDRRFVNNVYSHSLGELAGLAGFKDFEQLKLKNSLFEQNWFIVSKWNAEARYRIWQEQEAAALINAIDNSENGVLQWLKKHY